jgi:hypothetical protein
MAGPGQDLPAVPRPVGGQDLKILADYHPHFASRSTAIRPCGADDIDIDIDCIGDRQCCEILVFLEFRCYYAKSYSAANHLSLGLGIPMTQTSVIQNLEFV